MTIVPVKIPPGAVYKGTPGESSGRWYDVNLVRWEDDVLKPIGGWRQLEDGVGATVDIISGSPATETVRDMLAYTDGSGNNWVVFGSNSGLYSMTDAGVIADITPAGFVGGSNGVGNLIGYGVGPYGVGTYGTARNPTAALPDPVDRWHFRNWGEDVLALYEGNGQLYLVTPGTAQATAVSGIVTTAVNFVVTDERIVMALTNDPEPRRVLWSDREDYTDYTATVTNYAGAQTLQGNGAGIGIYKVQGQQLILTTNEAYVSTYLGAPLVYGFQEIGARCAPVSKFAVAVADRFAMWMSTRTFWMYDGTLKPVPCDIFEYITTTLDTSQVSKMFTMTIAEHNEIWWFYQSYSGAEIDTYVSFNYLTRAWSYGKMARTTGFDAGPYRYPLMVDSDSNVYNHELVGVEVAAAYAQTGPLKMNLQGNVALREVYLDANADGAVQLEFLTRQHLTDSLYSHGTFAFDEPISTTGVMGREIQMKVSGSQSSWRFGTAEFDAVHGGRR